MSKGTPVYRVMGRRRAERLSKHSARCQGRPRKVRCINDEACVRVPTGSASIVHCCADRNHSPPRKVTTFFDKSVGVNSLALQNGRIFAAGGPYLARYDGSFLESTVTTDMTWILAVVRQPDDKLVASGWCSDDLGTYFSCMARFGADGGLDTTFGAAGPRPAGSWGRQLCWPLYLAGEPPEHHRPKYFVRVHDISSDSAVTGR